MDPYANEWLQFLARWLHVVAGIAWIGASFYFIALDNHLRPPADPEDAERGVGGEAWEIHGGGFYQVLKYRLTPPTIPQPLYWFKWEAYTTWLSGFALLIVLYYFNANTFLIDKSVADLRPWQAIAISVALLIAAWLVYDGLCRLIPNDVALAAVLLVLVTLAAWGVSHLFSGRAEYIQIGAMLGTMMAGNVFFVIIPAHWELIRAKQAGREPSAAAALRAKQRSVHNNYLTLPVVCGISSTSATAAVQRGGSLSRQRWRSRPSPSRSGRTAPRVGRRSRSRGRRRSSRPAASLAIRPTRQRLTSRRWGSSSTRRSKSTRRRG
jgi:uncharacterized membrane protein